MQSAFVTGATGFVGANLVRSLIDDGVAVRALVRRGADVSSLEGLEIELVEGDLLDASALRLYMHGCDACFHVAGAYSLPDSADLYRVNVTGTKVVLGAAFDAGVSAIVHTSTVGTLGRPQDGAPARETDSYLSDRASHYVRSKFQAEETALEIAGRGAPVVIVHLAAPVGPWDRVPTVTGRRIVAVLKGRPPGYISGAINHVSSRDVARGMILAARSGKPAQRYLLARKGGNLTKSAFVELVTGVAGIPVPRLSAWRQAIKWLRRPRRRTESGVPASLECDPSWSVCELGLPQTPLEDAFREAVGWFRRRGMA